MIGVRYWASKGPLFGAWNALALTHVPGQDWKMKIQVHFVWFNETSYWKTCWQQCQCQCVTFQEKMNDWHQNILICIFLFAHFSRPASTHAQSLAPSLLACSSGLKPLFPGLKPTWQGWTFLEICSDRCQICLQKRGSNPAGCSCMRNGGIEIASSTSKAALHSERKNAGEHKHKQRLSEEFTLDASEVAVAEAECFSPEPCCYLRTHQLAAAAPWKVEGDLKVRLPCMIIRFH